MKVVNHKALTQNPTKSYPEINKDKDKTERHGFIPLVDALRGSLHHQCVRMCVNGCKAGTSWVMGLKLGGGGLFLYINPLTFLSQLNLFAFPLPSFSVVQSECFNWKSPGNKLTLRAKASLDKVAVLNAKPTVDDATPIIICYCDFMCFIHNIGFLMRNKLIWQEQQSLDWIVVSQHNSILLICCAALQIWPSFVKIMAVLSSNSNSSHFAISCRTSVT